MGVTELVRGLRTTRLATIPALMVSVVAIGVLAFLYIGHEVGENEFQKFDASILLALRDPADLSKPAGPAWFEESVLEITALGGYTLIIVTIASVIGFMLLAGHHGPALFVFGSVFTGWLVSHGLKSFYARPRPDLVPQLDIVHTASFPSGHAMMSTLVYLTLASVAIRLIDNPGQRTYVMACAVFISIIVGLSRIYLGVHWPSDVLAGWALGAAWAALSWLVVSALRRRREHSDPERDIR